MDKRFVVYHIWKDTRYKKDYLARGDIENLKAIESEIALCGDVIDMNSSNTITVTQSYTGKLSPLINCPKCINEFYLKKARKYFDGK